MESTFLSCGCWAVTWAQHFDVVATGTQMGPLGPSLPLLSQLCDLTKFHCCIYGGIMLSVTIFLLFNEPFEA
jgi:hypothetical protein